MPQFREGKMGRMWWEPISKTYSIGSPSEELINQLLRELFLMCSRHEIDEFTIHGEARGGEVGLEVTVWF